MNNYYLNPLSDDEIISKCFGEVTTWDKYKIQGKTFVPIKKGIYDPTIFGAYKQCACGKLKRPGFCSFCNVKVLNNREDVHRPGYYRLITPVVNTLKFKLFKNELSNQLGLNISSIDEIWNYKFKLIKLNNEEFDESSILIYDRNTPYKLVIEKFNDSDTDEEFEYYGLNGILKLSEKYRIKGKNLGIFNNLINKVLPIESISMRPPSVTPDGQLQTPTISDYYADVIYICNTVASIFKNLHVLCDMLTLAATINHAVDSLVTNYSMVKTSKESFLRYATATRLPKSGRANAVGVSNIKIDEVLLPRALVYEAIKSDIIKKLEQLEEDKKILDDNYVPKDAYFMYDNLSKEAIEVFEAIAVGSEKYNETGSIVVINRPPTLHKLSMMAFKIKLWDDPVIGVHINVVEPFNLDFDGDQVAAHIITTDPDKTRIYNKMSPKFNWFYEKNKKPIFTPKNSMLFGLYYASKIIVGDNPKEFFSVDDLFKAYTSKEIKYNELVYLNGDATCYGREKISSIIELPLNNVIGDECINSKNISKIIASIGNRVNRVGIVSDLVNLSREVISKSGSSYATLGDIYKWSPDFPEVKEILQSEKSEKEKYYELEKVLPKLIIDNIKKLGGTTYLDSLEAGSSIKAQSLIEIFGPKVNYKKGEVDVVNESLINGMSESTLIHHAMANREILFQKAELVPISGSFTKQIVDVMKDYIYRSDMLSTDTVGVLLPEWAAVGRTRLDGTLVTGTPSNKLIRVKSCINNPGLIVCKDEIDYNFYNYDNYHKIGYSLSTSTTENITQKQLALKHGGTVYKPALDQLIAKSDSTVEVLTSDFITFRDSTGYHTYPVCDSLLATADTINRFIPKDKPIFYLNKINYVDYKLSAVKSFFGLLATGLRTKVNSKFCYSVSEGNAHYDFDKRKLVIGDVTYPLYSTELYFIEEGQSVSVGEKLCTGLLSLASVMDSKLEDSVKCYVIVKALNELLTGEFTNGSLAFPVEFVELFFRLMKYTNSTSISSANTRNPRLLSKMTAGYCKRNITASVGSKLEDDLLLRLIFNNNDLSDYGV